jgi:hypothetical protein
MFWHRNLIEDLQCIPISAWLFMLVAGLAGATKWLW